MFLLEVVIDRAVGAVEDAAVQARDGRPSSWSLRGYGAVPMNNQPVRADRPGRPGGRRAGSGQISCHPRFPPATWTLPIVVDVSRSDSPACARRSARMFLVGCEGARRQNAEMCSQRGLQFASENNGQRESPGGSIRHADGSGATGRKPLAGCLSRRFVVCRRGGAAQTRASVHEPQTRPRHWHWATALCSAACATDTPYRAGRRTGAGAAAGYSEERDDQGAGAPLRQTP